MVLEDMGPMGPAKLFAIARILLHGQVALGMIGCLSFVYGTIHPGERVSRGKTTFRVDTIKNEGANLFFRSPQSRDSPRAHARTHAHPNSLLRPSPISTAAFFPSRTRICARTRRSHDDATALSISPSLTHSLIHFFSEGCYVNKRIPFHPLSSSAMLIPFTHMLKYVYL